MNRKQSLVDAARHKLPDGLRFAKVAARGFKFQFAGRVLPSWFAELADQLDLAMTDTDAANAKPGRTVGLEDDRKKVFRLWNGPGDSIYNTRGNI